MCGLCSGFIYSGYLYYCISEIFTGLCSSTDLDRLASFHAACNRTGRIFFVDEYQKNILDIFTKYAGRRSDLFKFNAFKEFLACSAVFPFKSGTFFIVFSWNPVRNLLYYSHEDSGPQPIPCTWFLLTPRQYPNRKPIPAFRKCWKGLSAFLTEISLVFWRI